MVRWIKKERLQSLQVCLLLYKVLLALVILIYSNKREVWGLLHYDLQTAAHHCSCCRRWLQRRGPLGTPPAIWSQGCVQSPARQVPSYNTERGHILLSLFTEVGGLSSSAKEADSLRDWLGVFGLNKSMSYKENYKNNNKRNGFWMLPANPHSVKRKISSGKDTRSKTREEVPSTVHRSVQKWTALIGACCLLHTGVCLFWIKRQTF